MSKANDTLIEAVQRGYKINGNCVISPSGKIRKLNFDKWGYPRFGVNTSDRHIRNVYVHKLVAFLKYGDKIFEKSIEVRHLNNNKNDFSSDNISIGTSSDNRMDNPLSVRLSTANAAALKRRKCTEKDVIEIRKLYKEGQTLRGIGKKFGITKSTVSYIVNKKTYK